MDELGNKPLDDAADLGQATLRIRRRHQSRKVNEFLHSGILASFGDRPGSIAMNVVEGKVLGFPVSADEVDGPVGVLDSLHEGFLISNVDGNEENLAQVSGDFETVDFVWVAAVGDDHLISLFGESIHDIFSDESGSAKDGDHISGKGAAAATPTLDLLQRIRLGTRL